MKDFGEILGKLRSEDNLLNEILNVHFYRISNNSYAKIKLLKIYPLINKIIKNQKNDLIIVLPGKKEISYLSSIFASLTFYKKNFEEHLNNFEKWLEPGKNVMLCSSGRETGKIYKYQGKKDDKYIILGSLVDKSIKIESKISTLLQFAPIKDENINEKNIGKTGYLPTPIKSSIDEILNINSYDNPMLYENKIVVLTNSYNSFTNFLNNEILISNLEQTHAGKNLAEIIKSGQIDDQGNIKDKTIEPLMVYTRDLNCLYEFSKKATNEKTVICDDIKKINHSYPLIDQIKNNPKKFNFLIFAEETEFEDIVSYQKKSNADIWKFNNKEINEFIKNIDHDDFDLNKIFAGRAYLKNKNHIKKDPVYLETDDNEFNNLDFKFKKIIKDISNIEEEKKASVRDLLNKLHIKMYQLRDHIFGFPSKLTEDLQNEIQIFFTRLKSMESFLNNNLYDDLVEIGNTFKKISPDGIGIFEKRVNELGENLKMREKDSKGEFLVLAYNLPRKDYYKKNIKEKWNIDAEVTYSIDTERSYKALIVPSELARSKLNKLLLNNNFEKIYFIGSKSLKQEMNIARSQLANRWIKFNISNEKKCEIIGIDKSFSNILYSLDQLNVPSIEHSTIVDIENFFYNNQTSFDRGLSSDQQVKTVKAFEVNFNGNCAAFFTEDYQIKVYNSVFDPSAYKNKKKEIKTYKNINYGDIIFLRYGADRKSLDQESISILIKNGKSEKHFREIKNKTEKISKIINECFGVNFTISSIKDYLDQVGYNRNYGNVISIANPDLENSTICPTDIVDLEKIFKACELKNPKIFTYNKEECHDIHKSASYYKRLHYRAGSNITKNCENSILNEKNLIFEGNPLRVDYIDGKVFFGSEETSNPEGYIVQVSNYKEPRELIDTRESYCNTLRFS